MTSIHTFQVDTKSLYAPIYEWEVLWYALFQCTEEQLPAFIAGLDLDLFTDRVVEPLFRRAKKLLAKTDTFTQVEMLAWVRDGEEGLNVNDVIALLESHGSLIRTLGIDRLMAMLAQYSVRRKAVFGVEQMLRGFDQGQSLGEQQVAMGVNVSALLQGEGSKDLLRMATGAVTTTPLTLQERMVDAMTKLQSPDRMMSVDIPAWDRMIGGLFPREYYVVHGPSGVTKTGLLVNLAYNIARGGRPAIYFTCEETDERIIWRLWSRETGIPFSKIKKRDLSPDDWGKIHDASSRIAETPFEVVDASGWTSRQIRDYCEKNGPYAAIFIDSFAFVGWGVQQIYEKADVGGKFFKSLAHDLDAAVVAICHNSTTGSRGTTFKGEHKESHPTMFNVEGGEGLTRPAWVCLELRLDEEEVSTVPGLTNVRAYLTKNRDGPPKQYMALQWDALSCTYTERIPMKAPSYEPPRPNMGIRPRPQAASAGVYRVGRDEGE